MIEARRLRVSPPAVFENETVRRAPEFQFRNLRRGILRRGPIRPDGLERETRAIRSCSRSHGSGRIVTRGTFTSGFVNACRTRGERDTAAHADSRENRLFIKLNYEERYVETRLSINYSRSCLPRDYPIRLQ